MTLRAASRRHTPMLLLAMLGFFLAHHPMFLSGFGRMQGDPGDPRLVNYVLEHGYRWVLQAQGHRNFWNPPFFFPAPNVAAYTDSMLAVGPPYWFWRGVGLPPDSAFQAWLLTISALNFGAFYALLVREFRFGSLASAAGALVFAFGASRVNQIGHPQLWPQFYSVIAVMASSRIFGAEAAPPRGWVVVLILSVVAQISASFYWGWFLALSLGIALGLGVLLSSCRPKLLRAVRLRWGTWLIGALMGAACLWPLVEHSARAASAVGWRPIDEVRPMIPTPTSWVAMGPWSWVWGWTAEQSPFREVAVEHEHRLGLGIVLPLAATAGLWLGRRDRPVVLVSLVGLALGLLVTMFPGEVGLWPLMHRYVPTASALRAVSRAGVMLLIPAGIGLAVTIHKWSERRLSAALVLIAFVVIEQGMTTTSYDKQSIRRDVSSVARRVKGSPAAFYFSPGPSQLKPWPYQRDPNMRGQMPFWKCHLDAMWAGIEVSVPTINGYSGGFPPGWGTLAPSVVAGEADRHRLSVALARWADPQGLPADRILWLQPGRTDPMWADSPHR